MRKIYGRDIELKALMRYVSLGKKILLKGRRGVGKTYLVKYLVDKIRDHMNTLYVNCERITTPYVLLSFVGVKNRLLSPDEILNTFFKVAEEKGIELVVFDEFVYLVRDFAKRKPYRSMERVIAHLRGLLSDFNGAVIFTASSLWSLYRLVRDYERRLARMFDVVMKLDALRIEDASKIAMDIIGDSDESLLIAELADGVPFYTEAIALTRLRCSDPYEAFMEELNRGSLNELFRALFSDLPPSAREVVYVLSKSPRTFESLEKEVLDDTLPYSLDYLVEMDIVGRIERKRRVTYYIRDKTFGVWVSLGRAPEIAKNIHRIKRLLSIGFESIVRELFLSITTEMEIPAIPSSFAFGPADTVKGLEFDGELDLFATDKKGRVILGEITIREDPRRKIMQLKKNANAIINKYGLEEPQLLLITYYLPGEDITRLAEDSNIKIMTKQQLNQLAKYTNYRPI